MGKNIVVFFDLDFTLYDKDLAFKKSMLEALKVLKINHLSEENIYKVYDEEVYKHAILFELLGFSNFTTKWNDADSYYILTLLCKAKLWSSELVYKNFRRNLEISGNDISSLCNADMPYYDKWWNWREKVKDFAQSNETKEFIDNIQQIKKNKRIVQNVRKAASTFDRVIASHMKLFPGVDKLLQNLLQREDTNIFIVSEGIEELQYAKIRNLGLDTYFPPDNIIITGALFRSGTRVSQLRKEILQIDAECERLTLESSSRQELHKRKQMLIYFLNLLYELSVKTTSFYVSTVHFIQGNKSRTRDLKTLFYASPDNSDKNMRLIAVGDRYDKDINPLIKLWGADSVLTIRIQQGKYKRDYPLEQLKREGLPHPTFTVNSVEQLSLILADDTILREKKALPWVPLLHEPITKQNAGFIDAGLKEKKFKFIKELATIIIEENKTLKKKLHNHR